MKIGFLTACFPERKFEELIEWAAQNDFENIEIPCWPKKFEKRRYAGVTHIDVDILDKGTIDKINDVLRKNKIEISSLAYYPNYLDPDPEKRDFNIVHLKKVIGVANKLGVGVVGTFVGRNKDENDDYNLKMYKDIFTDIVKFAEDNGIKIAIENCPMLWADRWPGGHNIARSPEIWDKMFELIKSDYIGLNFDPSHLVWQQIDYVKAVYDFKEKIFHTHAKDTKMLPEKLAYKGIYGFGFYEDKIAGMGDIDWKKYIRALYEINYDGVISIEHEDRGWEKDEENIEQGILLAKKLILTYLI
ncbi:MAG: sugar phosphate isomerase/epimerase [Actinobacteria bacterium]|nr:sugar phosphate isomerase/epimerase [Actinomycetota bacterium]